MVEALHAREGLDDLGDGLTLGVELGDDGHLQFVVARARCIMVVSSK